MSMLPADQDDLTLDDGDELLCPPADETPVARAGRIERERIMIEEAEEDIRQGRVLSGSALDDWLRRWAAGEPVEIPFPRR